MGVALAQDVPNKFPDLMLRNPAECSAVTEVYGSLCAGDEQRGPGVTLAVPEDAKFHLTVGDF